MNASVPGRETRVRFEPWVRGAEITAWIAGAVLFVVMAWYVASAFWFQHAQGARFDAALRGDVRIASRLTLKTGDVVGRLEIPRLKMSVIVAEGDDTGTLRVAAGHLADSPLPWEAGNSVIAAHRDSYFRPLQRIRHGDRVQLTTVRGSLVYTVTEARVVEPDDLSVLDVTETASLTLITCYPFSFVGTAPQRFIVRAERVDDTVTPPSRQGGKTVPAGFVKR